MKKKLLDRFSFSELVFDSSITVGSTFFLRNAFNLSVYRFTQKEENENTKWVDVTFC